IILAGGCSTRAKVNKLLLEVDRKPLIRHTIDSIKEFVDEVFVVTGKYHVELLPYLNDVTVVYNKNYQDGMSTSVYAGIKAANCESCLILPADITCVKPSTIKEILNASGEIRCPVFNGVRGHPLYLSSRYAEEFTKHGPLYKLCDLVSSNENYVSDVCVDDPFINFDIDTIDDYNKLLECIS
ncbi:MAG: nucleotidyltransferase family protein, partial [Firmicutes bacterium]|nr:nucleotidyltransferase family protein [Candidatus Fiminaster equi]